MPNNKSNNAVVLFGATRWGRHDVAQQFNSMGINAVIASGKEDPKALANKLNKQYQQWCVLPLDDFVGREACALAVLAPIKLFPVNAYRASTHKHMLRDVWNKYVTNNPSLPLHPVAWALYSNTGKVLHNELTDKGPYIVKPNAYAGSVGMEMVVALEDIAAAVARTAQTMQKEACQYEEGLLPDTHVLVEEAIPRNAQGNGISEYSVHMVSVDGKHQALAFSEKNINKISFIETSHLVPAELSITYQQLMEEICTDLLNELQVANLISNWEFIITPEGKLGLIEGQLRPSGDKLMQLISLSTSIDPYQYWISKVLGKPVDQITTKQYATVTWLAPKQVLNSITTIEVPDVEEGVTLNIDKEALLKCSSWPGPIDWYNRYIVVIASASSSTELMAIVDKIAEQVVLKGIDENGHKKTVVCMSSL